MFSAVFKKEGCKNYLSNLWHLVEVLNIISALFSCVCYAGRTIEVIRAVEFMKNNRGQSSQSIIYRIPPTSLTFSGFSSLKIYAL